MLEEEPLVRASAPVGDCSTPVVTPKTGTAETSARRRSLRLREIESVGGFQSVLNFSGGDVVIAAETLFVPWTGHGLVFFTPAPAGRAVSWWLGSSNTLRSLLYSDNQVMHIFFTDEKQNSFTSNNLLIRKGQTLSYEKGDFNCILNSLEKAGVLMTRLQLRLSGIEFSGTLPGC